MALKTILKIICVGLILVFIAGAFVFLFSSISDILGFLPDSSEGNKTPSGDSSGSDDNTNNTPEIDDSGNGGSGENGSGDNENNESPGTEAAYLITFPEGVTVTKADGAPVTSGSVLEETVYNISYVGNNKLLVNGVDYTDEFAKTFTGKVDVTFSPVDYEVATDFCIGYRVYFIRAGTYTYRDNIDLLSLQNALGGNSALAVFNFIANESNYVSLSVSAYGDNVYKLRYHEPNSANLTIPFDTSVGEFLDGYDSFTVLNDCILDYAVVEWFNEHTIYSPT